MDPGSIFVAVVIYAATEVYRKVADDAVDLFWSRIKASLKHALGREPTPADLMRPNIETVLAKEPNLQQDAHLLWESTAVLRRANLVERALTGGRVLWVDNHPEGNALERQSLTTFGLQVTTVETTRSAVACLTREPFDLVISDVARSESPLEGIEALPKLRAAAPGIPVVLYVLRLEERGVPAGAFGITNRPDELLHLCMDALERHRL